MVWYEMQQNIIISTKERVIRLVFLSIVSSTDERIIGEVLGGDADLKTADGRHY